MGEFGLTGTTITPWLTGLGSLVDNDALTDVELIQFADSTFDSTRGAINAAPTDILFQRYDVDGNALGNALQVGTYMADARQHFPVVSQLGNGDLVFSWQKTSNSSFATMTEDFVFRQHFSLSGNDFIPLSGILQTDHFIQIQWLTPEITTLANGGHFLV